jgi:hypothetical protein
MLNSNYYYKKTFYKQKDIGGFMNPKQLNKFLSFYHNFFKENITKSKACKFSTKIFGVVSTGAKYEKYYRKSDLISLAKFFGYSDKDKTPLERFKKAAYGFWIKKFGKRLRARNFVRIFRKRRAKDPIFEPSEEEAEFWRSWSDEQFEALGPEINLTNSKIFNNPNKLIVIDPIIVIRKVWFPLDEKINDWEQEE